MAKHLNTGKQGETLGAHYLEERGYNILHVNWRYSYYEIDLIAWKEPVLHFIEIKTRSNNRFGYPEEGVTVKKLKRIMQAAEAFLLSNSQYTRVQYDILSVIIVERNKAAFYLLEDVYFNGSNLSE